MKFHSYLLCYPNGIPFYAGVGRYSRYKAKKANVWAERIRNKIIRTGYNVLYIVFEHRSYEEALTHEISLIKLYGRKDIKTGILVNATDGGEGVTGRVMTSEQLAVLASHQRGKKWDFDDPRRKEVSKRFKGKSPNHSPELKRQLSEKMREFNKNNVERNKARAGISLSEKHKSLISQTLKKHVRTVEHQTKVSAKIIEINKSKKGVPQTGERKKKSIESLDRARKIRWERYHAIKCS